MSQGYMPYIQARHRSNPGPEKSKTIQELFDVGLRRDIQARHRFNPGPEKSMTIQELLDVKGVQKMNLNQNINIYERCMSN